MCGIGAAAGHRFAGDRLRPYRCVLFVVVGLAYELQTYGDGAIFSYAVAAEAAWAFHWHNIAGRFVVYLVSSVPGEI